MAFATFTIYNKRSDLVVKQVRLSFFILVVMNVINSIKHNNTRIYIVVSNH